MARLLIDLDGVKFFGSGGIGLLVRVRTRALGEGVVLVLVCSNRLVLRPLDLAGLLELFAVSESIETALGM
jgi:anti-sigma B factor antagonist